MAHLHSYTHTETLPSQRTRRLSSRMSLATIQCRAQPMRCALARNTEDLGRTIAAYAPAEPSTTPPAVATPVNSARAILWPALASSPFLREHIYRAGARAWSRFQISGPRPPLHQQCFPPRSGRSPGGRRQYDGGALVHCHPCWAEQHVRARWRAHLCKWHAAMGRCHAS